MITIFVVTCCPCFSPWTDKYETAEKNLYTEPVRAFLVSRMDQLKSEEVVYSREEYMTTVTRPHPQCVLAEVGHKRQGLVVVGETVPQDELVIECKVNDISKSMRIFYQIDRENIRSS